MASQEHHPGVAALLQHHSPALSQSSTDNLTCQWAGCSECATSPEALYDHVCEKHVGRKSTNNLNLACQWAGCHTTTVKRDHITSHIRVHVPLKPHKCDFCGKCFKRPQDLKKHVKTHADETVIAAAHDASMSQVNGQRGGGYQQGQARGPGMYPGSASTAQYSYMQTQHQTSNGYGHGDLGAGQHYNGNGMMHDFNQAPSFGTSGLTESRKRNHDMLEGFFGAAKRRQIDPYQYMDLNTHFGGLQALPFGMGGGYQNDYSGYDAGGVHSSGDGTAVYAPTHPIPAMSQPYAQPFEQLKTRDDLLNLDSFLEQFQNTVYDHSSQAYGRTAVPQPMPTMQSASIDPRFGDSVSDFNGVDERPSSADDTPALTPSAGSYASRDSPTSAHSNSVSVQPLYPSLNSAQAAANAMQLSSQHQYQHQATAGAGAALSGLANPYEDVEDDRRRYSGGHLHRARPSMQENGIVASPSIRGADTKGKGAIRVDDRRSTSAEPKGAASPTKKSEPDVGSPKSTGSASKSDDEEARQEAWVQNMRVIEAMRNYVKIRLANEMYDGNDKADAEKDEDGQRTPRARGHDADGDTAMQDQDHDGDKARANVAGNGTTKEASESLYPVLRDAVQAS